MAKDSYPQCRNALHLAGERETHTCALPAGHGEADMDADHVCSCGARWLGDGVIERDDAV